MTGRQRGESIFGARASVTLNSSLWQSGAARDSLHMQYGTQQQVRALPDLTEDEENLLRIAQPIRCRSQTREVTYLPHPRCTHL